MAIDFTRQTTEFAFSKISLVPFFCMLNATKSLFQMVGSNDQITAR